MSPNKHTKWFNNLTQPAPGALELGGEGGERGRSAVRVDQALALRDPLATLRTPCFGRAGSGPKLPKAAEAILPCVMKTFTRSSFPLKPYPQDPQKPCMLGSKGLAIAWQQGGLESPPGLQVAAHSFAGNRLFPSQEPSAREDPPCGTAWARRSARCSRTAAPAPPRALLRGYTGRNRDTFNV